MRVFPLEPNGDPGEKSALMTPERDRRFNPFPLLAAIAALAAGALFFFTRQSAPPAPEPEVEEQTTEPAPAPIPEPSPSPEPTPTPEPLPQPVEAGNAEAPAEADSGPPAPHEEDRPSEDDLVGPLPSREEPEEIAAIPTLHKEIPFNVPPPPRAAAVDVSQVAAQRERWPTRVLLRKPVRFPVVINGQNAGSVLVPTRAAVTVKNVYPDGRLEIGYHNATTVVPSSATDFLLRAKAQATPPPQHRQIVTFPEQTFNPALSSPVDGNR